MNIDEIKKKEANKIANGIESMVEKKFEGYKNLSYNTNTKGYDYEFAIFKILKEYLSSRFNFYLRSHLIDKEMKYLETLSKKGENEIDIIATFKSTIPKIILKTDKTYFVPYDAVAFLVEVKSILNRQNLIKDLNKLEKIASLPINSNRFGGYIGSKFAITDRPLRILIYAETSITQKTLEYILLNNEFWDLIYVVKDRVTIGNKTNIPFIKFLIKEQNKPVNVNRIAYMSDYPFIFLLLLILMTIPDPNQVNIIDYFTRLANIGRKGA